ncbi:hypothetical protein TWF506_003608 [Arthrobotrys conoides]|uniref:Peptidase A1 domain-containing protein n=1 Tax=Arthrobotrys conoides TaxID=74498 RepID=A0AAN8MXU9_9PEZI
MLILHILLLYHLIVPTLAIGHIKTSSPTSHPVHDQSISLRNHSLRNHTPSRATRPHKKVFRRADEKETRFGANLENPRAAVPGKLKVNSDGFGFFAQIDLGLSKPINLLLDTFSSFSIVIDRKEGAKNGGILKELKVKTGLTTSNNSAQHNLYSDGAWVLGQTTWYGEIRSPASAKVDPAASFYGYLGLPLRTSGFKRKGKDGVLGLAREQTTYSVNLTGPVPYELLDSRLPWGLETPPINGKYSYFTTYLNWREPEKQYLGLGYMNEEELGNSIGTAKAVGADGDRGDIKDWRIILSDPSHGPIIWEKSKNMTYAERLRPSKDLDSQIVYFLDTKSEFTFLRADYAQLINQAMRGYCNPVSKLEYLPSFITNDYPGSNVKFGGDVCLIPCRRARNNEGKSKYFQKHPIAIDLPFGEGYIRIGEDVSLAAYRQEEFIWPGDDCASAGDSSCVDICLSSIQPSAKNGPNYSELQINGTELFPDEPWKGTSGHDNVYGRTIWSNVFAKWDVENNTVSLWDYKGVFRDPVFNVEGVAQTRLSRIDSGEPEPEPEVEKEKEKEEG